MEDLPQLQVYEVPPSHLWCDWRIDWILASHIQERHYRPHTYCASSPLCVVRITAAVESSCRVAGSYKRVVSRAEVSSLQGPHRSKPPKALRVQGRFCCSTIMARLASCALGGFPSSSPSPSSSDQTHTQSAATNFFRFGAQLSIYSLIQSSMWRTELGHTFARIATHSQISPGISRSKF